MERLSENSERSQEADNLFLRAERLRGKSLYQQSLGLFRKALRGYEKVRDRDGIYCCLLALGDTCRMTGNFGLAGKYYLESIGLARALGSPDRMADGKVGLGLSLRARGKWKQALKLIRESKNVYRKRMDTQGIAFALWAEAGALRIKGDIIGAIKTYDESREVFQSIKDTEGIGYCLCGLGGASRIAGRFRTSLRYYISANKLFSGTGNTFGRAYSYCGIGNAYRMLNDYKNAFRFFSKATRLYRKIGDRVSYAYTLWGLATAYKMIGSYGQARNHLMNSLEFFKKTKDPRGMIYCSLGFGEIAMLQGKRAVALRCLSYSEGVSAENYFALEKCYAGTLRSFLSQPDTSFLVKQNMKGAGYGKIDESCYNRLGLKLRFKKLPLNIP